MKKLLPFRAGKGSPSSNLLRARRDERTTQWLSHSRQAGVGHLGLILAVVIVLAIGGASYFVFNKNKSSDTVNNETAKAIANAVCSYDDKDLCKFFTGVTAQAKYNWTGTSTGSDGQSGTIVMQMDGNRSYFKMTGGGFDWEVTTIDGVDYTKASDGTWWKEAPGSDDPADDDATSAYKPDFDAPTDNATVAARYKALGKEACGNLTCFKYQEVDADDPGTTNYIWFDDKDYLLRKYRSESADGTTEFVASYSSFSINMPSPVKELQEGQFIFPGAAGPTTL